MATSPNGVEYTHTVHIQDISLVDDVELEPMWNRGRKRKTVYIGGRIHAFTVTANPGVWYISNPLKVKVGETIEPYLENFMSKYLVVDIGEYPPQPTLRTLYMVIP